MQTEPIHPAVCVGHVHLRVADLDRSIHFYGDILGFNLTADGRPILRAERVDPTDLLPTPATEEN